MPTCRAERRWFSRQQLIARPTRELAALLGASRPEPDAMIRSGWPATEALILLADSYVACQEQIARTYLDRAEWTKRSILNVASVLSLTLLYNA